MINLRIFLVTLMLCLALPNSTYISPNKTDVNTSCWWTMLYPELCGIEYSASPDNEDTEITFKILEFFQK